MTDIPDGANPRAGLLVSAQGAPSRERQADDWERERLGQQYDRVREEMLELFKTAPEFGGRR